MKMPSHRKLRANVLILVLLITFTGVSLADDDSEPHHDASQAVGFSGGWIGGNGVTYRRYFGDHFLQGTFFGVVSDNANNAYLNAAFSVGTYLHKIEAAGIVPPIGLKVMAGADLVLERESNGDTSPINGNADNRRSNLDMSYYGGGVGLDIGNPGRAGLSLWLAVNYVVAYDGISSPAFDWFGVRPAGGILYGW
jgi:hypothetical protein